jgi:D-tyrosyl-tRNA(Tyr) deacylase
MTPWKMPRIYLAKCESLSNRDPRHLRYQSLNQRFFDDDGGMWKLSVKDIDGDILCISQFTLYGNTTKGNKPDFHSAMVCNA